MKFKSRRQRRKEARESGVPFEPQYKESEIVYSDGVVQKLAGEPRTYKETYGVGYERFDNKYAKVSEVIDG